MLIYMKKKFAKTVIRRIISIRIIIGPAVCIVVRIVDNFDGAAGNQAKQHWAAELLSTNRKRRKKTI